MKEYLAIENIEALEILDSRGNPTVQVEVVTEGGFSGTAMVPSGASTGSFEAVELRDNDKNRFMGKGVSKAVENVNKKISKKLIDMNVYDQRKIDRTLIEFDDTLNKSNLGANAILGVSLAVAKAAANSLGMELYNYIGGINAKELPVPMMNILNGGKHSDNNINIQEFMIVPVGSITFAERLKRGVEVYHTLKKVLKEKGHSVGVGDEGGFAPDIESNHKALDLIMDGINKAGYKAGKDVYLALDVAASEFYKKGKYHFDNKEYTSDEMIDYFQELITKYPIISIEDALSEDDYNGFVKLTKALGDKVMLVGDDLFVTNINLLNKGIDMGMCNAILIKPNQIGTITETLSTIKRAKKCGYKTIISHRSGETTDTSIADLAVGLDLGFIKTGSISRGERICKYNRLSYINNQIRQEK